MTQAKKNETDHRATQSGLWATLKRTASEFREDNLTDWAAALTYYGLLSLFPALIAMVSLLGLFGDPHTTTSSLTEIITSIGPESAAQTFEGPINSVVANQSAAGFAFVFGLLVALWSASGYIGAFMRASNVIYETEEGRPFWKLRPLQLAVTLVMVVAMALLALGLVLTGPIVEAVAEPVGLGQHRGRRLEHRQVAGDGGDLRADGRPPLLRLTQRQAARLPLGDAGLPGGAGAWAVVSAAFAFYVANFGSYDKTYGTLGGLVALLVWLWISNLAILFGHQLNAERERSAEIEEGTPRAESEIQLEPRAAP